MQTNLDFKDPLKTICWILSVLSWLLFLVSGWMGFSLLVNGKQVVLPLNLGKYTNYNIWSFLNILTKIPLLPEDICEDLYFPIQEQRAFYIILFGFL